MDLIKKLELSIPAVTIQLKIDNKNLDKAKDLYRNSFSKNTYSSET